jgi:hypothetical protein
MVSLETLRAREDVMILPPGYFLLSFSSWKVDTNDL